VTATCAEMLVVLEITFKTFIRKAYNFVGTYDVRLLSGTGKDTASHFRTAFSQIVCFDSEESDPIVVKRFDFLTVFPLFTRCYASL